MKRAATLFGAVIVGLWLASNQAAADVTREAVEAAIPKLRSYIETQIAADEVPGLSVAVVFDDEVVYLGGFGVREVGKPEPVDAETVFQLASLSKPISSTIVAALVSDGALTWDSRIADIDPGFQLFEAYPSEQVTVRDLFSHRSGLPGNAGNHLEGLGYNRDTILKRLRLVQPSSSFRSGYSYSNFGLTEGGVAAAKAAGVSWEDAAEAKLYEPLGMTSTSSRYADFLTRSNRATLHVPYEGSWQALAKRMPDAQAPAGGVSSNARDLAQWMRLELGNGMYNGTQLIAAEALEQTHLPLFERGTHIITGLPTFYGLGWNVAYGPHGPQWAHAGAFSNGARTVVNLLPSEGLGIVVLANAFPTGIPEAVASTFFDLVFEGEPTRDWASDWNQLYQSMFGAENEAAKLKLGAPPAAPTPPLALSAYTGTYANRYFGTATVEEKDGGLIVKLGPDGRMSYPLTHFDRDLFVYFPYAETPDVPYAATFEIGADQTASAVTFDDLSDVGFGRFRRVVE
jgi:CubicO group peptidase (beta-lactamase class C family)